MVFYLDGKYMSGDKQLLDVFTPGVVYYHGVFETLRVQDGAAEYVEEHLARLKAGLGVLKIKSSITSVTWRKVIKGVIRRNPAIVRGRMRIMVFKENTQVHCACMMLSYTPFRLKQYSDGLKALVVKTQRPAHSRYAQVKSLDYALFSSALSYARANGYDEAILVNARGQIFETSRGNIFVKHRGIWLTPPLSSGCLNGIMRAKVMALAEKLGIHIKEQAIPVTLLKHCQGLIMTNSLIGIIHLNSR